MDNVSFHKSTDVLQFLRIQNITFKFLVPYSPELNPIEEFFAMLKSSYHALRIDSPNLRIGDCLNLLLNHPKDYSQQSHGFYENMRKWLENTSKKTLYLIKCDGFGFHFFIYLIFKIII